MTQEIDRYSRTVAVMTCFEIEATRAQLERGMAWVYPKYNNDASLSALQEEAKAKKTSLSRD